MSAVCVTRTAEGYTVARTFRSQSAAQRAMNLLLEVPEAAFEPVELPKVVTHTLAEAILRDNPDAPLIYPVTVDEE